MTLTTGLAMSRWTDAGTHLMAGVLVLPLAALGLSACSTAEERPAALGACDVILDITGHPSAEWSLDGFKASTANIRQICADRVAMAALITDYSKASTCPKPSVDTWFRDPNPDTQEREQSALWAKYGNRVRELYLCGVYGDAAADPNSAAPVELEGSDILGAMQVVPESFADVDGPKDLIIFSDMANSMPPLRVPNDTAPKKAVAKLQEQDVVPDLQGVDVTVVGAGTSDEWSPAKQAAIVNFWEAYFKAAGVSSVTFQQAL